MSPLVAAGVWVVAGLGGGLLLPALRARRLAALIPLAALVALVLTPVHTGVTVPSSPEAGGFLLDRTGQGVLMASAVSLALMLMLSPAAEAADIRTMALCGAAAVVAVSAQHPVVMTLGLLGCVSVLALRWISLSPGRLTMASGRVAIAGSAVLLAATTFLPVSDVLTGPRPVVASALLAGGLATLLGLLPVGGWALSAVMRLRGVEAAAWPLLLVPAALLLAQRIQLIMPPLGVATFGRVIVTMGLITAVWQGLQATRAQPGERYPRVLAADVGLAAAAIGGGHTGLAQAGGLFLILTHLLLAPLLLQPPGVPTQRTRRLAWLLLSGVPPAPSFWGRFLLLEGLSQVSSQVLLVSLIAMGLLFLATVLGVRGAVRPYLSQVPPEPLRRASGAAAWVAVAGATAMGFLSANAAAFVFGGT